MLSNKRWLHALHNEKVCETLSASGDCNDWIITTAFYAALHFTASVLFPLQDTRGSYNTINQYYAKNEKDCQNLHDAQIKLIHRQFPGIADAYEHLHDMSHNARYIDYDVESLGAQLAKSYLKKIKKYAEELKK